MNEDTTGDVAQLQAEIKRLKDALTKLKGNEHACTIHIYLH